MPVRLLLFAVLLAFSAAFSRAESPAAVFEWPAGPAGATAREFFAMVADSSDDSIRAFETAHRTAAALASISMDERIQRARDLRQRFGALTPERVVRSADGVLVIGARAADGRTLDFEFNLVAGEPGKISSIGVALLGAPDAGPSRPLNVATRSALVEGVAKAVEEVYVFPEDGRRMAAKIRGNLAAKAYDAIADESAMARRLTDDLRSLRLDKHGAGRCEPVAGGGPPPHGPGDDPRRDNFAFRKVEWLPGNIGYLKLDLFLDDPEAKATGDAAMAFLRNADALIVDLRDNGGGSPAMIRHLTSYFFPERTHLNDMFDRDGKLVEEFWTGDVPGVKFAAELPVFVLTSAYSFSGAEEFAYNLKALKRATIVGETTGGGAHPVAFRRLDDRFVVGIPFRRAQNPITRTNWEGVGVEPDVKVPAAQALDEAKRLAAAAIGRK
jgi:hypothetical protein